jgi:hypothetical protein
VDLVPRPEWAFPLKVGVHVESFYSALPEQLTREVLQALCDDTPLLAFLERHPLGTLEFSDRLPVSNWRGSFHPQTRDVVVNSFRGTETYGKEFYPAELWTISEAGRDLVEALQRTLYHELGHSVLDVAGPEIEHQITRLLRSRRAAPISILATGDPIEYFCETFAAYRFEDSLADKDPEGYDMVEAVLRTVGRR